MSAVEADRERGQELARTLLNGVLTPHDMAPVIADALAEERKRALLRAAESLKFTPLSQRESGVLSDYTQGIHAAAQLVALMAEDDQ